MLLWDDTELSCKVATFFLGVHLCSNAALKTLFLAQEWCMNIFQLLFVRCVFGLVLNHGEQKLFEDQSEWCLATYLNSLELIKFHSNTHCNILKLQGRETTLISHCSYSDSNYTLQILHKWASMAAISKTDPFSNVWSVSVNILHHFGLNPVLTQVGFVSFDWIRGLWRGLVVYFWCSQPG